MPRARVAALHDLADGAMNQVSVGETDVLLSRIEGRYYATGARCTHYGAPLETGVLSGCTVICPWHHAVFNLTDGALCEPPAPDGLARYTVEIEGEDVYVTVPDGAKETPRGATYRESGGVTPAMSQDGADDRHVVIVGGGAAGQAAAEGLRQAAFRGRVTLVVGEEDLPYDRTALSKGYAGGGANDEALPLRSRTFYQQHDIDLIIGRRVERLDASAKTITFQDGETLAYDAALVATGGTPRALPVPGGDRDGVVLLRSHHDARRLVAAAQHAQRVVIIGSSFIGMEAAASLKGGRNLDVAVVSRDSVPFQAVLGRDVGRVFQSLHEEKGIAFHLDAAVASIQDGETHAHAVVLEDGTRVEGDLVLVGIGVQPATAFIEGVQKSQDGGIVVDAHLQAAEGLWAAGDIAVYPEARLGASVRIEHWRLAQQHGRHAARAMTGERAPFLGVPFFWSGQFGTSLRYVGHASKPDDVVIDGSLDDRSFVAYYLQEGSVVAACGVGRDKPMAALHALMATGQTPSAQDVRAGFDPEAVLGRGQRLC